MFAFKKFSFFQQVEVKVHGWPANSTCHVAGGASLWVGTDAGAVHVLDEGCQAQGSFSAYGHKVLAMAWAPARQLLVTVGLEEPGIATATIKLWDAQRAAAAAASAASTAAAPTASAVAPLKVHRVFGAKHPESEVTSLAVSDSSSSSSVGGGGGSGQPGTSGSSSSSQLLVAVGLAAGSVYLFSGADLSAPKSKLHHAGKLVARPDAGELWRVTALAFTQPPAQAAATTTSSSSSSSAAKGSSRRGQQGSEPAGGGSGSSAAAARASEGQWLFVVTESQTLAFNMADQARTILDQQGLSAPGCAALAQDRGTLVVARDDALYEYTPDTRAGCTAFDGVKQGLGPLKRYLYVVSDDTSADGAATSKLQIVDVKNKLVAGAFTIQGLGGVAAGPGGLVAWASGGRLFRFFEVELSTQLEVLFRRSLHKLALDLAARSGADPALLSSIHQTWGDALYAKGEYEAAMGQYLETTGHLEPSYVIRRFLDAQRIASLTRYLEHLHSCGLAGADHTTLLLNCYTKLKDVGKLDAFIHRDSTKAGASGTRGSSGAAGMAVLAAAAEAARRQVRSSKPGRAGSGGDAANSSGSSGSGLTYDMETAFRVLRSAGYSGHALSVAERAGQPEWVLDVLLEDMGSYAEAVAFIGMLSRRQKARVLSRYGKLLIASVPDDTTALLMDLCLPPPSGHALHAANTTSAADDDASDEGYVASVADFAHLYTDRPTRLLYLCEFILFNASEPPPNEMALYHILLELYLAERLADEEAEAAQAQPPPKPQQQQQQQQQPGDDEGAAAAAAAAAAGVEPAGSRRDKARDLLARGWQPHMAAPTYDPEHALVLCRQHGYRPGLVLLYEKMRLHREVLQVYMEAGDVDALIAACLHYGDAAAGGDPHLWAEALEFLCKQPGDCSAAIAEVLQHIEAARLLPPLVVLQTLAANPGLKVSLVKDYVARQLQAESAEISRDRATIARLAAETASMKAEAAKLKSTPHVFQNSRCAATGQPLELPVVHFLCGHSFNLRSLGEADSECPLCAPDFKRVLDIRRNMRAGALKPDEFFTQLDAAPDGFAVVAEHFGRGMFGGGGGGGGGG